MHWLPVVRTAIPESKESLACGWMHRGLDLLKANSPASLGEAVSCFDQAIALRRSLPLTTNAWFRYGLMAGWMNRGDALSRLGGEENWREAVISYDEALMLSFGLPLDENCLYPRRMAIAWINRGDTLQKEENPANQAEAAQCFREALAVLEDGSAIGIPDRPMLQAGAWVNLSGALLNLSPRSPLDVIAAANKALSLVGSLGLMEFRAAETGLKARHALCRAIAQEISEPGTVRDNLVAEATDIIDEGLSIARHWQLRGEASVCAPARDLFCFGCHIYQIYQPHFLAEFILESVDPEKTKGALRVDHKIYQVATASIKSAVGEMLRGEFSSISTPAFHRTLDRLRDLRVAQNRLETLRSASNH